MKQALILVFCTLALAACGSHGAYPPPEEGGGDPPEKQGVSPQDCILYQDRSTVMCPIEKEGVREMTSAEKKRSKKGCAILFEGWYASKDRRIVDYIRRYEDPPCDGNVVSESHYSRHAPIRWKITNGEGSEPNLWAKSTTETIDLQKAVAIVADAENFGRYVRVPWDTWLEILSVRLGPQLPKNPTRLEVVQVMATSKVVSCASVSKNYWVSRTNSDGTQHDLTFGGAACKPNTYVLLDRDGIPYLRLDCFNFSGDVEDRDRIMQYEKDRR